MDVKTVLGIYEVSVITDLNYFCLSIQWNLFTKYPKRKFRGRSSSSHNHLSLANRRMLSPVTPLNLKRLVFGHRRTGWPFSPSRGQGCLRIAQPNVFIQGAYACPEIPGIHWGWSCSEWKASCLPQPIFRMSHQDVIEEKMRAAVELQLVRSAASPCESWTQDWASESPATGVHPGKPLLSTHNAEGRTG